MEASRSAIWPGDKWHIARPFAYGDQTRQLDGVNCGIFACVNASCIALGRRLPALSDDDFRTVRTWLANIMYESGQAHETPKADEEADDDDESEEYKAWVRCGGDEWHIKLLRGETPPQDTGDFDLDLPHLLTLVVHDEDDEFLDR